MKICVLSDLHGFLIDYIQPCELVLICGDIVPLRMQRNKPQCEKWLKTEFADWIKSLPCEKVVFVAGNHDFVFENRELLWINSMITHPTEGKAIYLENCHCDYLGSEGRVYRIYGTPACHIFGNWAFMYSDEKLQELYSNIPGNCDILISHDAPKLNNCGLVPPNMWHSTPVDAGNEVLASAILDKKPKYAFCGHIHEGNHQLTDIGVTKIANVSILDDAYDISYEPLYLDI